MHTIIPTPLHADSPKTMRPENRAIWSPHWMVMAANLTMLGETGERFQTLDLRSRQIGVYRDDPDFPDALKDADKIAARLLVNPIRVYVHAEKHGTRVGRHLFSPQWKVRYRGSARTPLERYRQGDDPDDIASDLIAN